MKLNKNNMKNEMQNVAKERVGEFAGDLRGGIKPQIIAQRMSRAVFGNQYIAAWVAVEVASYMTDSDEMVFRASLFNQID